MLQQQIITLPPCQCKELAVMAIIRALPHSFDEVICTISVLDKFDKQSVIQSLRNMEQTCSNLSGTSTAFSALPNTAKPHPRASNSPSSSFMPQNSHNLSNQQKCDFCSHLGHLEVKCFLKEQLLCQLNASSPSTAAPASTLSQSLSEAHRLHQLHQQVLSFLLLRLNLTP